MSNPLLPSQTHTHIVSDIRNFNVVGASPTVNDDANDNYQVNSIWTNTATDVSYICVDNTVGAAIWKTIAPVLVNETRFVDSDYGQAAGTQDELTAAWNNIATAYTTSPSPGTVYVQPGDYAMSATLELRDGVHLFFAEGARVSASGFFMFTDPPASAITVQITGHGVFTVDSLGVLSVQAGSQIIFQGDRFDSGHECTQRIRSCEYDCCSAECRRQVCEY